MEEPGFTLSLALVDALPVLFFGAAAAVLGARLDADAVDGRERRFTQRKIDRSRKQDQ